MGLLSKNQSSLWNLFTTFLALVMVMFISNILPHNIQNCSTNQTEKNTNLMRKKKQNFTFFYLYSMVHGNKNGPDCFNNLLIILSFLWQRLTVWLRSQVRGFKKSFSTWVVAELFSKVWCWDSIGGKVEFSFSWCPSKISWAVSIIRMFNQTQRFVAIMCMSPKM